MRVVFMGSPPFALPVLAALLDSRHEVAAVVTRPDRPKGRGRSVERSPLVELARSRELRVLQPETARDPAFVAELRAISTSGESSTRCPRPFGLSGGVTSAATECRLSHDARKTGTANGGEPRKTTRMSRRSR